MARAEHITSEWRPVPLKQGVYFNGLVHFTDQTVKKSSAEDDMSGLVTDVSRLEAKRLSS